VQRRVLDFFNTSTEAVLYKLVAPADAAAVLALRPVSDYAALNAQLASLVDAHPQLLALYERYRAAVEEDLEIDDVISRCEALSRRLRAAMGVHAPRSGRSEDVDHINDSDDDVENIDAVNPPPPPLLAQVAAGDNGNVVVWAP